jgi:hypothetical protein
VHANDLIKRVRAEDPYYDVYTWGSETTPKETAVPLKPVRKVSAAGLAGAFSILIVFILGQFSIEVTNEVAAAITAILAFAAGYLVPASSDDEQIIN